MAVDGPRSRKSHRRGPFAAPPSATQTWSTRYGRTAHFGFQRTSPRPAMRKGSTSPPLRRPPSPPLAIDRVTPAQAFRTRRM
ncbi:MAG: hypothetical protein OZSIB_1771 [Candidatus Ozemobacter sibiricus]|uniref:Uncharacterized protein n=1 Tax=Candidatus Ozemobacter sibiricus TaxID=2268124 RepID=A0A367ZL43_9BACT|nr:MAG: hypothetical protein OZSIB_1771 [Candidatus Ozemobacter sibiricus]